MSAQERAALLRNRINTIESKGKSAQGLINSLRRELMKIEREGK